MDEFIFSINYVSKLLNIPKSTLRFWEEKKIINISRRENGYRAYTLRNIINIADIISYKDLGFKLKDLQKINKSDSKKQLCYINNLIKETNNQIEHYNKVLENLNIKKRQLNKLFQLYNEEYTFEKVNFKRIAEFDINNQELIRLYSKNTSLYIRYYNSVNLNVEKRGIIVNDSYENEKILWNNDDSNFIVFLVKERVNFDYHSNIGSKLKKIDKNISAGIVLLEYLTTALDENKDIVDYYKAYLQVK